MFTTKGKSKLLISLFLFSALFLENTFAAKYQSIEDMLSVQKTIRVLIDVAPGFGNQTATIKVINKSKSRNSSLVIPSGCHPSEVLSSQPSLG